jgi:hypothetical protein
MVWPVGGYQEIPRILFLSPRFRCRIGALGRSLRNPREWSLGRVHRWRTGRWRNVLFQDADLVIREELRRDERLLWSGQPPQGMRLCAADAFMIPFSILWGGFAIFWETTVVVQGAPLFFMAWGVPFVVVGLYLIVGRFWFDARQRAQTYYALTDSRVIIVSGVFSRSTRSLNVRTLSDVAMTKKKNGSGMISFGPVNPMYAWWGTAGWPGMSRYMPPCLELDCNADEVYEKILAAQKAGSTVG